MFEKAVRDGHVLKPLETWHADAFAEHMGRARDHIRPWVGPTFVTDTVDGARATLKRYATATSNDGARIYGLWSGDKIVGGVMFVTFDPVRGDLRDRLLARARCSRTWPHHTIGPAAHGVGVP